MNVAVPPRFGRRQARGRRDGDAGRVVVGVGDRDVGRVDAVVVRVGARRRGGDDRVATSPSSRASSTPVTVTVCATFQFAGVNVRLAGADRALVVSLELSAIVTSAVGCDVSTTVNVAVPPASVVVRPEVGVTVMPAASLSVFVTATSVALNPL